jgi:hypothetical protein
MPMVRHHPTFGSQHPRLMTWSGAGRLSGLGASAPKLTLNDLVVKLHTDVCNKEKALGRVLTLGELTAISINVVTSAQDLGSITPQTAITALASLAMTVNSIVQSGGVGCVGVKPPPTSGGGGPAPNGGSSGLSTTAAVGIAVALVGGALYFSR